MKLSDISPAKGLKFKLTYLDGAAHFPAGALLRLEEAQRSREFLAAPYGDGAGADSPVLCRAAANAAEYIHDLFAAERDTSFRCLFEIEEAAEYSEEQNNSDISEDFEDTSDESEDIDDDESEYMGMGMSM